ncbi:helix-turn-helix domain-containing protein [Actinoallomurus soli]|uniref:helix-turn-helix domain-containing protein n=1 Tax=Actinoallomurus soli TaxID=2952535 RepID=UPI0020922261|nr:helix-turn-helix transcriptional regulator [Actinoallomurus soli]MCO5971551.1 helix-turn-helix domain-containing protein [Actinoallomurus soli]
MATITPTIRLRRLGMALRDHREAAGLTLDEAARVLMRSPSSLSRIEKGLHHVPVRDLEYILGKYGVADPAVRDRLFDWCRNGRKKGWWQRYATDLSPEMMDFIGLEADASAIDFFELMLIPGLLQTEEYARALIETGPFAHDPHQVSRLVAIRMKRQDVLTRTTPPSIRVILDEAVLRRQVGGPDVMRAQLQRLLDVAQSPQVTLQVIPFSAGAHWGVTGAFTLMKISGAGALRVVTVDSLSTISYREEDQDLDTYTAAFDELRSLAPPATDSQALIRRLLSTT